MVYKNRQNGVFIKATSTAMYDNEQKELIRALTKKEKVDMRHLNELKQSFLKADPSATGLVRKSQYLKTLVAAAMKYPEKFFLHFLSLIQTDASDSEADPLLSYERLVAYIDVFLQYPSQSKKDSNNSDSVKASMSFLDERRPAHLARTHKLVRFIQSRVDEKFKDFRHAFRFID